MLKRISKFKLNGWFVLGLFIAAILLANVAAQRGKDAQKSAGNIIASLPVSDAKIVDGTIQKKLKVTVDPKNGQQMYGSTNYLAWRDEITGGKYWNLMTFSSDQTQAISIVQNPSGRGAVFVFPRWLAADMDGNVIVQARFTMRDGTAVVREYRARLSVVRETMNQAVLLTKEASNDLAALMTTSVHVAARAPAANGEDTFIRLQIDPVDWMASIRNERIVPLDETINGKQS
jgi:hypothetical protein